MVMNLDSRQYSIWYIGGHEKRIGNSQWGTSKRLMDKKNKGRILIQASQIGKLCCQGRQPEDEVSCSGRVHDLLRYIHISTLVRLEDTGAEQLPPSTAVHVFPLGITPAFVAFPHLSQAFLSRCLRPQSVVVTPVQQHRGHHVRYESQVGDVHDVREKSLDR